MNFVDCLSISFYSIRSDFCSDDRFYLFSHVCLCVGEAEIVVYLFNKCVVTTYRRTNVVFFVKGLNALALSHFCTTVPVSKGRCLIEFFASLSIAVLLIMALKIVSFLFLQSELFCVFSETVELYSTFKM